MSAAKAYETKMPIVVTTYMNVAEILAAPPPRPPKKSACILPLPPKESIVHTATVLQDEGPTYNQLAATLLSINEKLNQPPNSTEIPTMEAEVTQFSTSTPNLSNSHGNTSGSSYMRYKIRNQNRQGVGHEQGMVERVKELESSMKYNQIN